MICLAVLSRHAHSHMGLDLQSNTPCTVTAISCDQKLTRKNQCAVEGPVHEVARNAVRSLRGVRLCSEGHEDGRVTHLVLGQSRRTLKVCLKHMCTACDACSPQNWTARDRAHWQTVGRCSGLSH